MLILCRDTERHCTGSVLLGVVFHIGVAKIELLESSLFVVGVLTERGVDL
jgi:hypothetical protein